MNHAGALAAVPFAMFVCTFAAIAADWQKTPSLPPGLTRLQPSQAQVFKVVFFDHGKKFFTIGNEPMLEIWDLASKKPMRWLIPKSDEEKYAFPFLVRDDSGGGWISPFVVGADHLALHPNGKQFVTASYRGINLWELGPDLAPRPPKRLAHCHSAVNGLFFTSAGQLVSAGFDKKIHIWDVDSGREVRTVDLPDLVFAAALSSDEHTLALRAGEENRISLWEFPAITRRIELPPTGYSSCMAFAPTGQILATAFDYPKSRISLWNAASGQQVRSWSAHQMDESKRPSASTELRMLPHGVQCLAFSHDGHLLASGGKDGVLSIWEVATGREIWSYQTLWKHHRDEALIIRSVCFAPDGKSLLFTGHHGEVYFLDLAVALLGNISVSESLSDAELERLWLMLEDPDPRVAYQNLQVLRRFPNQAAAFVERRAVPIPRADADQIAQWLKDLDAAQFVIRERAKRALEQQGETAHFALEVALRHAESLESRRRLQRLLARLEPDQPAPQRLRLIRAAYLLEAIKADRRTE